MATSAVTGGAEHQLLARPHEHSSPRDGCTAPSNARDRERAALIPPSWLQRDFVFPGWV